jgi:photosystem II stability/assembly factor-like uncharacterized protein
MITFVETDNILIMKKKLLYSITVACTLLFNQGHAQMGTWQYQNPTPGPNGQNALCVYSADTVYVGGWNGYIARTFNGGTTWTAATPPSANGISALEFIKGQIGFTTGDVGELFKTTNGGNTWSLITLPNPDWYVASIKFVNANIGYIGGATFGSNGDSSFVAKTIDGGITWTDLPNLKRTPNSIAQIQTFGTDSIYTLGFAAGFDGTMFTCSHTGGTAWTNIKALPNAGSSNYNQGTMYFLNNKEGYLYCTTPDTILKTIDGGLTWINGGKPTLTNGTDFFPGTLHYFNSNNAVAFASYGANPIVTTNAATTWSTVTHASNTSWIYRMAFVKNSLIGFANGGGGEVLKTINGGLNWISVQSGLRSSQFGVHFSDNQNGISCGNNGSIYKTSNGGNTFSSLNSGVTTRLTGIQKIKNTTTIYSSGFAGVVLKSTNDGTTWTSLPTGITSDLHGLHFANKDTGIAIGKSGVIIKTLNGGATWSVVPTTFTTNLNRVVIKDVNVYIASDTAQGPQGVFYKSHNLGQTFSTINIPSMPQNFKGIHFINDSVGRLCGTFGTILKTQNYGQTWVPELVNTTDDFFGVSFADNQKGIAVGAYGLTFETADGGQTWNQNLSVVSVDLYDVSYPNMNNGWGVGRVGAVAKYTNSYIITAINENQLSTSSVNIYPNPSNGLINFSNKIGIDAIELYDNLGKLIESKNINSFQSTYEMPNGLSTGIYFLKFKSDKESITKKIILQTN